MDPLRELRDLVVQIHTTEHWDFLVGLGVLALVLVIALSSLLQALLIARHTAEDRRNHAEQIRTWEEFSATFQLATAQVREARGEVVEMLDRLVDDLREIKELFHGPR